MKFALGKNSIIWLFAAVVSLVALTFVYLRGQDKNWDLLNYHYFAGFSLLNGNYVHDIAPVGLVSFLNPAPNILAFLTLSQLAFPASAWALTLVQLLSLPLLVCIARQIGRDLGFPQAGAAEFLALALCLLAPLWWSEMGTTFVDSSTTPIVLSGLYLGLRGIAQEEKARYALLFSGLLFGLAAGLKLTNAPFAMGFSAALLVVSLHCGWRQALRLSLLLTAGMVMGFLLTAWWNIHLFQRWESPFFPLYNAWFKSPYANPVNFPMNFSFNSIGEFLKFLWAAVWGTAKTSEIPFADARLLILLALTVVALATRKRCAPHGKVAVSFLVFLLVSFALWAKVFAYQRYLIPIEVLFGFGIWILLSRLSRNPKRVAVLLAGCVVASAAFIKVPDWGHTQSRNAQANPFGLQLPSQASATPARYLVGGNAISYILPFLHPDSRFYGVHAFNGLFAQQTDELIRAEISRKEALPLRILIRQEAAVSTWSILSPSGLTPDNTRLSCTHFRSDIDTYVICEIRHGLAAGPEHLAPIEIDLQGNQRPLPPSVLGLMGLSVQEPWGRWSNSDAVTVQLANCLPKGKFKIDLRGHAFGPNIGQPVRLALGSSQASVLLGEEDRDLDVILENNEPCLNMLSIFVPQRISPLALGRSTDERTLGIGLVRLDIRQIR